MNVFSICMLDPDKPCSRPKQTTMIINSYLLGVWVMLPLSSSFWNTEMIFWHLLSSMYRGDRKSKTFLLCSSLFNLRSGSSMLSGVCWCLIMCPELKRSGYQVLWWSADVNMVLAGYWSSSRGGDQSLARTLTTDNWKQVVLAWHTLHKSKLASYSRVQYNDFY